jgi:hypothetical protein
MTSPGGAWIALALVLGLTTLRLTAVLAVPGASPAATPIVAAD